MLVDGMASMRLWCLLLLLLLGRWWAMVAIVTAGIAFVLMGSPACRMGHVGWVAVVMRMGGLGVLLLLVVVLLLLLQMAHWLVSCS